MLNLRVQNNECPIKSICSKCNKHDICHNYMFRGIEITADQLEDVVNTNNPCIDSDVYCGDLASCKCTDGSIVNMVVQIYPAIS